MKKRKNRKKRNKIYIIIGIIVIVAILSSLIIISKKDYYVSESRIDKLNKTIKTESKDLPYYTVGWLQVQGTNIDYPIIRSKNDGYHYPEEEESYLWTENVLEQFENNIIVNGHNIFNLSAKPIRKSYLFKRSEELMNFVYYDFAKKNKYIKLTLDGKEYLYKIFSVSFVSGADATYLPIPFELTEKEMKKTLRIIKKHSIYDYKVDVNEKDDIITVTTCTRMFIDRDMDVMYVSGRLLRDGEKNKNYGVVENKNHKIVEEAWEDVDDYENENEEV